ncbi:hypothetical protein EVAR_9426_1 [Eumeta japonica]|uniref:Uncharacterized protein n=1 Tax=Eumeta variegata TaxID=151549 RepID=A0A4C1UD77_EUMVA|nr:hypothetical protein EVAR_9426_1 [Eumeta japonica]
MSAAPGDACAERSFTSDRDQRGSLGRSDSTIESASADGAPAASYEGTGESAPPETSERPPASTDSNGSSTAAPLDGGGAPDHRNGSDT